MKVIKMLIVVSVILVSACTKPTEPIPDNSIQIEAEDYDDSIGEIRIEHKSNASDTTCVHLGPDSDVESEGIGDALIYDFSLESDFPVAVFEVQYSDDVGGNIIHVYIDCAMKGSFRTETTGGWNNFALDSQIINLGRLSKGQHTLKLEMTKGGSWGVLLDFLLLRKQDLKM